MSWETITVLLGALGGLEFLKWLFNRKTNSRLLVAEAESAEFHTLQETNEFLQKQLQAKEERFVEQTERLRRTQDDLFRAKESEYQARLELALKKCEDEECPFRRPPNAQTPPKPGVTKEEYHNQNKLLIP
jgi:hypothetical protein